MRYCCEQRNNKKVHWLPPMHKFNLEVISLRVYSNALGWWCTAIHQNKKRPC
nr:MAG TPA: hypothetical protein [Caudoviricetes sp.]